MEGILENDTANGPSGIDQASVTLTPPAGATVSGTVTDAAGDVVGFTVDGEGTWAYSDTTGDLTFTPVPGLVGDPTSITYTVDSGNGLTSDPATIRVSYSTGIVANPDTVAVLESWHPVRTAFLRLHDLRAGRARRAHRKLFHGQR